MSWTTRADGSPIRRCDACRRLFSRTRAVVCVAPGVRSGRELPRGQISITLPDRSDHYCARVGCRARAVATWRAACVDVTMGAS